MSRLMTTPQVIDYLQVSRRTLERLVRRTEGEPPWMGDGALRRWYRDKIDGWYREVACRGSDGEGSGGRCAGGTRTGRSGDAPSPPARPRTRSGARSTRRSGKGDGGSLVMLGRYLDSP